MSQNDTGTPPLSVRILRLESGAGLPVPSAATAGSAGADLAAAVWDDFVLAPGARGAIPTGFAIALPPGFEAQVRPRSGLALRHGITLLNAPGTIDSDYRGEIHAVLVNLGDESFTVHRGDRIAQLVVAPVTAVSFDEVSALDDTGRGAGGFGHTGTRGGPSAGNGAS